MPTYMNTNTYKITYDYYTKQPYISCKHINLFKHISVSKAIYIDLYNVYIVYMQYIYIAT